MGNPKPLVSVTLPFFNAPFLELAVKSILDQTYSNYELILIDNNSSDESQKIAKSFTDHPKVRLINEPRKGVVFAVNRGIEEARGDFIARMDSDDVSTSNRLEKQVEVLLKDDNIGVVSGMVEYVGSEANQGFIHYVDWLNSIKTNEDIHLNQFVEFPVANPTLMFRKGIFSQYGRYSEGDFPEDYELFLRLQLGKVGMTKIDEVVLKWRDSETRLTRTDDRYSQDAFFRIKARYLARWLAINNSFHPKIYIWGAGRLSRRRSDYLLQERVEVIKYIDLKETKHVMDYRSVPDPDETFIVSYVGNRGAREEIREFLNQRGYKEGMNYIIAS